VNALRTILAEVQQVLERIDDGQLDQLAAGLLKAPRVFVTGEGRSGFMARAFAMRLAHLGRPVAVLGETTTPPVSHGDTLVAVSGSGTTHGTVHAARAASDQGLWIVAVTSDPKSPLARLADRTLIIPAATKWRRAGEPATEQPLGSLFDQACHLALDAVCLHVARRTGADDRQTRSHHATIE
jgi:6-phospho-3-hexuloisomerase